jgi:hypothetical protein
MLSDAASRTAKGSIPIPSRVICSLPTDARRGLRTFSTVHQSVSRTFAFRNMAGHRYDPGTRPGRTDPVAGRVSCRPFAGRWRQRRRARRPGRPRRRMRLGLSIPDDGSVAAAQYQREIQRFVRDYFLNGTCTFGMQTAGHYCCAWTPSCPPTACSTWMHAICRLPRGRGGRAPSICAGGAGLGAEVGSVLAMPGMQTWG